MNLQNATVFVTGATSGFGLACAERFGREGARLVVVGRRGERLAAFARRLPADVHTIVLDVRDRKALEAAAAALPAPFAAGDVLVNCAGLALGREPAHLTSLDDWEQMIDTNCKGLLYMTRALVGGMVARNRGHVVNIGSIAGTYAYPGGHVYCGSKAFVRQVSLALRADLLGTAVRVTDIEPGLAETEFSVVRFHGDAERAKKVYTGLEPLVGEDVADLVHFAVTRPAHVNINTLEVMPVAQAPGGPAVKRR